MSTIVRVGAKESKNYILVYDCTGKYSGSNKGGWGYPNYDINSVTEAYLEIYPPQSILATIVPVYHNLPTLDNDIYYEIPVSLFSMTKVESGVWKIGYRVKGKDSKGVAFEIYNDYRFIFTDDAECCVDKLVASTSNTPLNVFMKDERRKSANELSALLDNALRAKKRNDYNNAQTLLRFINLQCECC